MRGHYPLTGRQQSDSTTFYRCFSNYGGQIQIISPSLRGACITPRRTGTEHTCCDHCCCQVTSVVSDSVRPHRRQPTRLPHPWDSPGKNTGVGCHFLLQCMKVKSESEVAQSVRFLATPWTAAYQAPQSMGFSRQEYWSGVPLPSPLHETTRYVFRHTDSRGKHVQGHKATHMCTGRHTRTQ